MADRAYITPKVLKWARESAKISEEVAAKKVNVSVDKLVEWENAESLPTINQAKNLAKAYKRPFALFFLPDVPRDFQPLQDFRKKGSTDFTTSSIFIIREIQQKQSWISDLYKDEKRDKLPFVGKFSTKDDPQKVASNILKTLGINPASYANPFKEWVHAAESNGIFVSRTSNIHSHLLIDPHELQGFAIADPYAPFVFINTGDWESPRLFTLVHELAHIWIAESGISNQVGMIFDRDKYHPIELFSNEVAANALMPASLMREVKTQSMSNTKDVYQIAKKFGVSVFAFLIRMHNLELISRAQYRKLSLLAEREFEEFLKREEKKKANQKVKEGGPNYYLLRLNRNGRLFTQAVIDSYKGDHLEPTLASNLLNVPVNKFHKLEAQLYNI